MQSSLNPPEPVTKEVAPPPPLLNEEIEFAKRTGDGRSGRETPVDKTAPVRVKREMGGRDTAPQHLVVPTVKSGAHP